MPGIYFAQNAGCWIPWSFPLDFDGEIAPGRYNQRDIRDASRAKTPFGHMCEVSGGLDSGEQVAIKGCIGNAMYES